MRPPGLACKAGAQSPGLFLYISQVFVVTDWHGFDLFRWNNQHRDDDDLSED